jgi:hypothetical protein
MFQISFFIESRNANDCRPVVDEAMARFWDEIISIDFVAIEEYWKVDGWHKVTCDVTTKSVLNRQKAEALLSSISDKWEWDDEGYSVHSSQKDMGARFCDGKIKFVSCWFEDLQ